jgi:hypothetical protein
MLVVTLLVALAQAGQAPPPTTSTPPHAERVRMLVFDVRPTGGVSKETAENLTGLIAALLSEDERLEVLAGPDLRSIIDLETQKQSLGCSTDTSCLAEVAGALNAQFVLAGDAGFLGSLINLNLSLYDQTKASNIGRRAVQAPSLDQLPAALRVALGQLVVSAIGTTGASTTVDGGPGVLPWLTVGVGGAAVVAGGVVLALGIAPALSLATEEEKFRNGDNGALDRAAATQKSSYQSGTAPTLMGIGALAVVVGAATAVGGMIWATGDAQ